MITSHPHADAVAVVPRNIDARRTVPAIAALVCMIATAAIWHVVIATALGAGR